MDPTGMSSPLGQLVIAAGLIAAIVVGVMALRRRK
jgi:subtilase family serine protease